MDAAKTPDWLGAAARIFEDLSHASRVEIIVRLLQEPGLSSSEIAERLGAKPANVSQHLTALNDRKFVAWERKGPFRHYRLGDRLGIDLVKLVCKWLGADLGEPLPQPHAAKKTVTSRAAAASKAKTSRRK